MEAHSAWLTRPCRLLRLASAAILVRSEVNLSDVCSGALNPSGRLVIRNVCPFPRERHWTGRSQLLHERRPDGKLLAPIILSIRSGATTVTLKDRATPFAGCIYL